MTTRADANYELAMLDAYCALVRVLDKSAAVRAQDVGDALHAAAEARRRDGDTEVAAGLHSVLNKLIDEVRVGHPPLRQAAG